MQFFRKHKSQAAQGSVERPHTRSHEQLPVESPGHPPAFPPPVVAGDPYENEYSYQQHRFPHQHVSYYEDLPQTQPHPAHALGRSQSHRNSLYLEKPTVNVVAPAPLASVPSFDADAAAQSASEQSWSLPTPESPRTDQEPRKAKKSIFTRHSSSSKENNNFLGRNLSVKRKANSGQQQSSREHQNNSQQSIASDRGPSGGNIESSLEHVDEEALQPPSPELQMQQTPVRSPQGQSPYGQQLVNRYPHPPQSPTPREYPSIQRVDTEPINADSFYQQRAASDSFHSQVSSHRLPQNQEDIKQPAPQHQLFPAIQHPPSDSPVAYSPHKTQIPQDPFYLHRQSPQLDSSIAPRPPSQQSFGPPSPIYPQYHHSDTKQQNSSFRQSLHPSTQMPHQGGMSTTERATGLRQPVESVQQQGQISDTQGGGGPSPYAQGSIGPPQGSSFKGNMSQQSIQEQGRDTPAPSQSKNDFGEVDVRALLQKHEELQAKYQKVKRYYFEKENQVQQLQNTVAHQRMAVSRTVLDDNEYSSRFNRLDGAIKDLAFSIRKEWKSIPTWLQAYVNEDAHTVGTKEMTAVGRAVITRWLVDELFERHFHPSLEPNLSIQLKNIEMNIRRQQVKVYTDEDKENTIARISNWRRTTLDGLKDVLQSKTAEDNRSQLIDHLVEKLVASLEMNLNEPPPPGLENGARMIVENTIGIAEKIPLESREVCIEYFLPGAFVTETHMKVESTLPPLTNPKVDASSAQERYSVDRDGVPAQGVDGQNEDVDMDKDKDNRDSSSASTANSGADSSSIPQQSQQQNMPPIREQRKKSVFGSLISKKPTPAATGPSSHQQEPPARSSSAVTKETKDRGDSEKQENQIPARIRFAAFMAVEVRGKGPTSILMKAPVYPIES